MKNIYYCYCSDNKGNLLVFARQRFPAATSLHAQMSFVLKPRTAVPLGTNH